MISVDSTKSFIFPKTLLIMTKSSVTKSSVTKSSVIHSKILLDLLYVKKTQKKQKKQKRNTEIAAALRCFFD